MTTDQLATGSASGAQTSTQSPQAFSGGTSSANSSHQDTSVQAGTTNSLLNSGGGVALHGSSLTTVPLPAVGQPVVGNSRPLAPRHHVPPALFGLPVLLIVIAAVLFFWASSHSVKNTTI